jgi:hypothetical protein
MFGKSLAVGIFLSSAMALATAAESPAPSGGGLSAAQIAEKNVAARGGIQGWRAVQGMTYEGKIGIGGNQRATLAVPAPAAMQKAMQKPAKRAGPSIAQQAASRRPVEEVQVPFRMELARSHKMRFELQFNGHTAVQVFDGAQGWKVRPFLNRSDVEPFTPDETKIASMQSELDGYLVDYAAKGTRIERVGTEKVEGHDTYKLKLTLKSGSAIHLWIDAKTFLEAKMEGQPRRLDGVYHPVEVYFRDYRAVSGLQVPFVVETRVLPVARTGSGFNDVPVPVEKITIEKVVVNSHVDDALFRRPQLLAAASLPAAPAGK